MNDASLISLAIQIPLVGIFIWYSLRMYQSFQTSLEKRDAAYLATLEKISSRVEEHHSDFKAGMAKMEAISQVKKQTGELRMQNE